jgi:hypothetical protein
MRRTSATSSASVRYLAKDRHQGQGSHPHLKLARAAAAPLRQVHVARRVRRVEVDPQFERVHRVDRAADRECHRRGERAASPSLLDACVTAERVFGHQGLVTCDADGRRKAHVIERAHIHIARPKGAGKTLLVPSHTAYSKRSKGRRSPLRFTKTAEADCARPSRGQGRVRFTRRNGRSDAGA